MPFLAFTRQLCALLQSFHYRRTVCRFIRRCDVESGACIAGRAKGEGPMTNRAIVWGVAIGALLPAGSVGCVGGGDDPSQTPSGETYAVSMMASTRASLPTC